MIFGDKELNEIILEDLYRCTGKKDKKTFILFYLKEPTFKFTVLLRKYQYSLTKKKKIRIFIHKIRLNKLRYKYGFFIPYKLKIGKGLYIGHIGTIIINPDVIIGNNVNLSQGITIGQENRGDKKGTPIIGDEVWIGTNAVIVGKVNIGNNVLIAPNSYVNFDVPDNSIVMGNPAHVKQNHRATENYICNKV